VTLVGGCNVEKEPMSKNIVTTQNNGMDNFEPAGTLWKIQISGAETGNQFSLVEGIAPPGSGSAGHRHPRADQAIYVLEGKLDMVTDSKTFSFAKGETGLIRRGTPHREVM
jgi:quercetin dioxygenase-like cupin family protein